MSSLERNNKPSPSGEINFRLPEIERFSLENGLKIIFIRKEKLPIVQLSFVFNAGGKFDPAGKKGLANLFSMVIDEGAGRYNSLELSDEFDKLGTHFNIHCSEDNIFFSVQTLSDNFLRSAELASMVLLKPRLEQSDLDRERRKVITRILQVQDESDEIADLVFEKVLFGNGNPYAFPVFGYRNDLESITLDDIKKFYSEKIHPSNCAVIVVGNIARENLENVLSNLFSRWQPKQPTADIEYPFSNGEIEFYIVDKKDAVQSEIRAGHLTEKRNEKVYYSKTLMNMILGGQFTSRINLNLREKNGYTYGATSRFNYFQDNAFFSVSTSVNADNTAAAVREIINELNGIKGGITQDELEFAKYSLIRKFPSNFETYRQIATNLIAAEIHSLPGDYFNKYLDNIISVDLEEINKVSLETINTGILKVVIVGDINKIKNQLDEFSKSKITETDIYGNPVVN